MQIWDILQRYLINTQAGADGVGSAKRKPQTRMVGKGGAQN